MELVKSGSIYPDLSGGFDTQLTFDRCLSLSLGFTYNLGGVKRLPSVYADKNSALNPVANVSTNWRKGGESLGMKNIRIYLFCIMIE